MVALGFAALIIDQRQRLAICYWSLNKLLTAQSIAPLLTYLAAVAWRIAVTERKNRPCKAAFLILKFLNFKSF